MSIFNKKYNLEKDKLVKEFDYRTNQYYYAKNYVSYKVPLVYNELDIKTKKTLLRENKKLLLNKDLLESEQRLAQEQQKKKMKYLERYDYLKSIGFGCDSFFCRGTSGSVSNKLKEYLDELLNEENVLIGIHRVGQFFNDSIKEDIFEKGLLLTGHLGSGAVVETNLKYNVSYYPDNNEILEELKYANGYKNSKGSILVRIPDSVLENHDDLYIFNGVEARLNPKYIIGYVPVYENHHIENIEMNPNFVKEKETYSK